MIKREKEIEKTNFNHIIIAMLQMYDQKVD